MKQNTWNWYDQFAVAPSCDWHDLVTISIGTHNILTNNKLVNKKEHRKYFFWIFQCILQLIISFQIFKTKFLSWTNLYINSYCCYISMPCCLLCFNYMVSACFFLTLVALEALTRLLCKYFIIWYIAQWFL